MREETLDHLENYKELRDENERNMHVNKILRTIINGFLISAKKSNDPHLQAIQAPLIKNAREALKS